MEKKHKLELLKAQVEGQEQTMHYIGREIHDSVAQKLTLASLYSQMAQSNATKDESTPTVTQMINTSLEELRELSRTLTDQKLHKQSLANLIREESELINATGITRVQVELDEKLAPSAMIKNAMIRIIQEFTQNSLKHAQSSLITIRLFELEGKLNLHVSDNGVGFIVDDKLGTGSGLNNMQRRVESLKGEYFLRSIPGEGTELKIHIPVVSLEKG